jgi:alkanesulfonate monooxygenase SsuD/methylene tetrahydromethanopterin reductase-like flavin-dependent oxidoreductase (luciferase family)
MFVDAMTVPQPLSQIGDLARRTQSAGFSGLLFTETGRTAYLNAAVASQAAPGLELSTGVAVAFPRSPFVTAAAAWELQEASGGNFRLGLGTQVRTHVVRRYGAAFERPGPRLRDYLLAVKACFSAFRSGKLDHHGDFYDLDFITPQWSAGPIDAPDPKVDIAAVAKSPTACTSTRSASPATSDVTCYRKSLREQRNRVVPRRTSRSSCRS